MQGVKSKELLKKQLNKLETKLVEVEKKMNSLEYKLITNLIRKAAKIAKPGHKNVTFLNQK